MLDKERDDIKMQIKTKIINWLYSEENILQFTDALLDSKRFELATLFKGPQDKKFYHENIE